MLSESRQAGWPTLRVLIFLPAPKLRVPLDKSEGGVKDKDSLSVFLAPFLAREVEDQDSGNLTLITRGGFFSYDFEEKSVPPTIDSA